MPASPVALWLHLLGVMASCIGIVPWARLKMRPIQLFLLTQWSPISKDMLTSIQLTSVVKGHLSWWLNPSNISLGVPLAPTPASITMRTDACTSWGWGGYIIRGPYAQGKWSQEEAKQHINWLELMAVWNCLRRFSSLVRGKSVLLQSDNTAVVFYINKQGGTRSATLCYLAWDLLHWCIKQDVTLRAVHLAGSDNHLADLLSRKAISPVEWSLHKETVDNIFNRLGRLHIDFFASHENKKLQPSVRGRHIQKPMRWTPSPSHGRGWKPTLFPRSPC